AIPHGIDVLGKILFKVVVAWHFMTFPALFMKPHPETPRLRVAVLNLHTGDSTDARASVRHDGDECAIAKTNDGLYIDTVEDLSCFVGREDRRFSLFYAVLWTADDGSRIQRNNLPDNEPIEKHSDSGELLLDSGFRLSTL